MLAGARRRTPRTGTGRWPDIGRAAAGYGTVGVVAAFLGGLLTRPWVGGWSNPVVYGNDTIGTLTMVEGAGWTGTARGVAELGAPHGTSWVDFPLGPDRLHLVGIRLVRLLSDDPMVVVNLWLVIGFVLVAWAAFGVLSHLGVGSLLAGSLAVVFSLAPYHFETIAAGHFFLATYYAVPLGVLLALWANDGSLRRPRPSTAAEGDAATRRARRRTGWVVVWVLVVGSASAYYAVFATIGILAVGLVRSLRRREVRTLAAPAVVAVAVMVVVVANVAGDLAQSASAGTNQEASHRATIETDSYGLRPAALAVPPPGHRFGAADSLGERYGDAVPRRGGSYLGLLALAGLAVVVVRCVRDSGRPDPPGGPLEQGVLERFGVIAVASVAVGAVGGGGLLVALVGFGQIRVWSRISIVVAFVGLAALGVVLERRTGGAGARVMPRALLAVGLVAVAMVDQVANGVVPDPAEVARARAVDEEVAESLLGSLDDGDDVAVHPPMAFPSGVVDRGAPMHSTLAVWSAADGRLNWSAGAIAGRGGDWRFSWAAHEPDLVAAGLAAAGFEAILVDRRVEAPHSLLPAAIAPSSGDETAEDLRTLLGAPAGVSSDGTREWFDLRPLRADLVAAHGADRVDRWGRAVTRPIGVTFSGAATATTTGREGVRLLGAEASFTLRRADDDAGPVDVHFLLSGEPGATVEVGWPDEVERVTLGDRPVVLERRLTLDERDTVVELATDAGVLAAAPATAGDVRLELGDLTVVDATLAGAVGMLTN